MILNVLIGLGVLLAFLACCIITGVLLAASGRLMWLIIDALGLR